MSNQVLARLRKPKISSSSDTALQDKFRVAVFGQTGVGKTALSVRFITRRYIGEYDSSSESIYERLHVVPPCYPVFFEIMDTPGQQENGSPLKEKIKWADAFLLVYAINDQVSFTEIIRLKFLITYILSGNSNSKGRGSGIVPPIVMVGNKSDIEADRMVSREEGEKTAADLQCPFFETSARHSLDEVMSIFEQTYKRARGLDTSGLVTNPSPSPCFSPDCSGVLAPTSVTPPPCSNNTLAKLGRMTSEGHIHSAQAPQRPLQVRTRHKSFKHINKIQRLQAGVATVTRQSSDGAAPATGSCSPLARLSDVTARASYSDSESTGCNGVGNKKKTRRGGTSQAPAHRLHKRVSRCDSADQVIANFGNERPESDPAAGGMNPKHAAEEFVRKVLQLKAD